MGARTVAIGLVAVFAAYLGLTQFVPVVDDELYYWCWSKELQWSYYDHPAMTAVMIRLGTEAFGDNLFGVRFPACVAMVTVLGVLAWVTRPRTVLLGALATPLFTLGAVLITPDTPLLLFWALYLGWLVAVHRRLDDFDDVPQWLWLAGGTLLGCAILGKYTAGLLVPAGLLSFAVLGRMHLRRWAAGYVLHLAAGVLTTLPILIYNVQRDFEPLRFQWTHAMADEVPGLRPLGEFVGVQVLLFGLLPLLLLPWTWVNRRELLATPVTRVGACLYAFPLAFFLLKSTRGSLEGNWAMASYLGFWPVAAAWHARFATTPRRRRLARWTFCVPAVCVALLAAHLAHPIPWLPVRLDRLSQMAAKAEYARRIAPDLREKAAGRPVFVIDYQWAAFLRFNGVDARQIAGVTRPSHFTQRPERPADHEAALIYCDFPIPKAHLPGVTEGANVAAYEFRSRGELLDIYHVWECRRTAGGTPPETGSSAPAATVLSIPSSK